VKENSGVGVSSADSPASNAKRTGIVAAAAPNLNSVSRPARVCADLSSEASPSPALELMFHLSRMDLNIAFRKSLLATARRAVLVRWRPRSGLLHTSTFLSANPVPFPTTVEPPPPPPEPARIQPDDRIDRKRRQAELLQKGREVRSNPSRPATVLQKRFWKSVTVEETSGTLFGIES
jgi:hypothetical protein